MLDTRYCGQWLSFDRTTKRDARGLQAFAQTYTQKNVMAGVIIYAGNECYQLTETIYAAPWDALFREQER